MAKTDVAVKDQAAPEAAAKLEELEAELASENEGAVAPEDLKIPMLKIGQALTAEVQQGDAAPGEFINSLTGEGVGREVTFIVSRLEKGRFLHGDRSKGERARKVFGAKNVPWNDDPFYGRPFSEHPEAEETYKKRVNAGEIDWGKGPKISTTYDFTGYVVSGLEEGEEPIPVCLSLKRGDTNAAKKWMMILDVILKRRYWDSLFSLSTDQRESGGNKYYGITIRQSGKPSAEQKLAAVQLADALRTQTVQIVGEDDDAATAPEPDARGGMDV